MRKPVSVAIHALQHYLLCCIDGDITYKAMLCVLFIYKHPVLEILAMTRVSLLSSTEANQRRSANIHDLNSQWHQQEKAQEAKEKHRYVVCLCLLLFLTEIFFHV